MTRRTHVLVAAAIATTCVHCSLLLYNDDELSDGQAPSPTADASSDTTPSDVAAGDTSSAIDAGLDADARTIPDAAVVWPVNGHAYEVVIVDEIDWHDAKEAAEKRGGHLVTITSEAENNFVFSLAGPAEKAWEVVPEENLFLGPWIGCIQASGSVEPDGGFGWVTGEPFVYDHFDYGQPDNAGGSENACHFFAYGEREPVWNDNFSTKPLVGYIVEYE